MINEILRKEIHKILLSFIDLINKKDIIGLMDNFDIKDSIYYEIIDDLISYFGEDFSIGVASYELACLGKNKRPYIDIYEMNEANTWGGRMHTMEQWKA